MAVYKIARYEVRPDARDAAERAMHELAAYVRKELPDASWTTYRDPNIPMRYVSLSRADDPNADAKLRDAVGMRTFKAALAPLLIGEIELTECELVTSSDLARRRR